VALRKGTISGYSPRMRLDLIVNAMFRSAVQDAVITINNPSIWRPILAMEDAISAYIRVIEAHESISGIFNIASGNYTVGEVGDLVKGEIEQQLGSKVNLVIKHLQDFRNYKVSFEKAKNVLSFHPQHDVQAIVRQLVREMGKFSDWNNPVYYNIQMFRTSENGVSNHVLSKPVGVGR
jgi:nucleoside-diphosphate-sugar epimerase